jgi:predicted alpha/beta-fold hydrolase
MMIDNDITSKLNGWKDCKDYYTKAACYHRIPTIKVPTLFMNSLDDPIIGPTAIDYEIFEGNQYCALATNKHGGHIGYHETIFSLSS